MKKAISRRDLFIGQGLLVLVVLLMFISCPGDRQEAPTGNNHWERVANTGYTQRTIVYRLEVPTGWVVWSGSGLTFVPDPDKLWRK